MSWEVIQADCVEAMREMDEASVDAIITDPPYGLEFMGKEWDRLIDERPSHDEAKAAYRDTGRHGGGSDPFVQSRVTYKAGKTAQQWHQAWATEALRVLKPGGFLVAAGGTRTFHRLVCAIEDAEFEIRDCVAHMYGSGFPKSLNVSEALRKLPACSCDVAGEVGSVDTVPPASAVSTASGTEAGTMPLTGSAADSAIGVGADVGADAAGSLSDVNSGIEEVVGDDSPVVLGSSGMAGAAEGEQVGGSVSRVEVAPEALGDEVVDDEAVNGSTVGADSIAGDDFSGDGGPATPSVLPLAPPPSGVSGATETPAVGDAHAGTGAVDGDALSVAGADSSALGAGELHGLKCKTCGGVRRERIPEGFGTAMKPAFEPWTIARKPLVGTVAQNVLEHGTGALNIDGCRIGTDGGTTRSHQADYAESGWRTGHEIESLDAGRWPPNVALSHLPECEQVGIRRVKGSAPASGPTLTGESESVARGQFKGVESTPSYADPDGTEQVAAYSCAPGCPVAALDEQSGESRSPIGTQKFMRAETTAWKERGSSFTPGREWDAEGYGDTGGASRFFYVAKASRAERNLGLNGFEAKDGAAIRPKQRQCRVCGTRAMRPGPKPASEGPSCGHDDWEWVQDRATVSGEEGRAKGALRNSHPT